MDRVVQSDPSDAVRQATRPVHWSDRAPSDGPEWAALRRARAEAEKFWGDGHATKRMVPRW